MTSSFARSISCAVLLVFLAGLGSWMFSVGRLSHEMGDRMASVGAATDSAHGPAHDVRAQSQPAGESEHDLLHTAAHIQPCPFLDTGSSLRTHAGVVRSRFLAPALARAVREAPFRPPRLLSSLA